MGGNGLFGLSGPFSGPEMPEMPEMPGFGFMSTERIQLQAQGQLGARAQQMLAQGQQNSLGGIAAVGQQWTQSRGEVSLQVYERMTPAMRKAVMATPKPESGKPIAEAAVRPARKIRILEE